MTKEEAIAIFRGFKFLPREMEAADMAIKALEQEPCEDAISRQDLDKALYECFHEEDSPNNITDVRLGAVRNFIKNFPSVTPQKKAGKWIEGKYRDDDIRYNDSSYKCNKCGRIVDFKENYCPSCGHKMIQEVEE